MSLGSGLRPKAGRAARLAGIAALIALTATAAAAPVPAPQEPVIDNSAPAVGCPDGWAQVEIRPPVDAIFVCAQPGGGTYLFNDSDQVWNIADYDAGRHVVTTVFQTARSALFRTTFSAHFARLGLAAPRDVVRLPDYYDDVKISPHQNLTIAWNQQLELEKVVASSTFTAATALFVRGSPTRKALVACATAAWTGIKGTRNVWEAPDVQKLIVNGLAVAGGATGCKRAVNAASGVQDGRALTTLDEQITAAKTAIKEGQAAQKTATALAELVSRYFR